MTLGLGGVAVVLGAVTAAMGFFSYLGVPSSLVILQVVPFLVLAVGADNIFIFVLEYQVRGWGAPAAPGAGLTLLVCGQTWAHGPQTVTCQLRDARVPCTYSPSGRHGLCGASRGTTQPPPWHATDGRSELICLSCGRMLRDLGACWNKQAMDVPKPSMCLGQTLRSGQGREHWWALLPMGRARAQTGQLPAHGWLWTLALMSPCRGCLGGPRSGKRPTSAARWAEWPPVCCSAACLRPSASFSVSLGSQGDWGHWGWAAPFPELL